MLSVVFAGLKKMGPMGEISEVVRLQQIHGMKSSQERVGGTARWGNLWCLHSRVLELDK